MFFKSFITTTLAPQSYVTTCRIGKKEKKNGIMLNCSSDFEEFVGFLQDLLPDPQRSQQVDGQPRKCKFSTWPQSLPRLSAGRNGQSPKKPGLIRN